MIKISLPNLSDFKHSEDLEKQTRLGGIYFIYGEGGELLYIGKAKNLRNRLKQHFQGKTNTKESSNFFVKYKYLICEDPFEREMYETYLINTMKPKENKSKVYFKCEDFAISTKKKFVTFLLNLVKVNKGIPLGRYTIEMICKNNGIVFYNWNDPEIRKQLSEEKIKISNDSLLYVA
ncbi:nucleotide excision repair endonuclease [Bacillus haynesii]|uniref:nucleotide excision repair endonuclease n=1 Tax=Bacillus haynesii TaxID=1925021 RepID=UPI00227FDE75|nr:nucleotide excision repair endonuclease [Bacillus haynesii]MCY8738884.1 nucleotide excision repair endonuclease [Bacillus haynesii]MCY9329986.1 nucleotide excision repair endonuclease [Bacillus haynesii]MCY9435197.1 nucleotide excision repair endonuclease [Bacillus haynesii]MEC0683282.1 nucleotide excision repair endonuclease [Bacillus haynesii]